MTIRSLSVGYCVVTVIACFVHSAVAEVPIEGKAELVDVILAAQRVNAMQYQQGDLSADVSIRRGTDTAIAKVHILWNEGGTYWKHLRSHGNKQYSENGQPYSNEIIQNDKQWSFYTSVARLVQTTRTKVFSLHPECEIRPSDLWFMIDKRSFSDIFDPKFKPELLTKYVIREESNGEIIVVEKHYKIGGYYSFRISLPHGGNVISYDTVQEKGQGIWKRGHFDWAQDDRGAWYVKELVIERSFTGSEAEIDYKMKVKYTKYTSAPDLPADRFSIESLRLPKDTQLEEYGLDGKLVHKPRQ